MESYKIVFYVFGSENSQDYDVLVECESIPTNINEAHSMCKNYNEILSKTLKDKELNSNLIVIKDGIIVDSFKGTCDELINCLYYTYNNHKQFYPNPIKLPIERDFNEKLLRIARFILSFYSRTELRKDIKAALRGDLKLKLETLSKIDFTKIEFKDKKENKEDIYKVIAFQFGQFNSLIDGYERDSYTKNGIIKNYPLLASFLNREDNLDLNILNQYLDNYIKYCYSNINNLRLNEK